MPTRRSCRLISSALRAEAAERRRLAAAGAPRVQPAVEHRPRVEANGAEHARCDRGARAALADRHDRTVADKTVLRGLSRCAVWEVSAAGDEAAVALVRLADVVEEDLVVCEPPLELVDRDRLHLLVSAADSPADEVEDPDRVQSLRC